MFVPNFYSFSLVEKSVTSSPPWEPEILGKGDEEGCPCISVLKFFSIFRNFIQHVALARFNPKRIDTCDLGGCPGLRG